MDSSELCERVIKGYLITIYFLSVNLLIIIAALTSHALLLMGGLAYNKIRNSQPNTSALSYYSRRVK